jgi:hypothetical protein
MQTPEGSGEDVRVARAWMCLSRMRALRAHRPGGATVRLAIVAHHEGLPEKVRMGMRFEHGALVSAGFRDERRPDVVLECQYSAWMDYISGALSAEESVDRGRFAFDGPDDAISAVMDELDAEESRAALEAAVRELIFVHMSLLRSGAVSALITNVDVLLAPKLRPDVVEHLRLAHREWEARTRPPPPPGPAP